MKECCGIKYLNDEKFCHECGKSLVKDSWLTVEKAYQYFNGEICKMTIYNAIKSGALKSYRKTKRGKILIKLSWLDEWANGFNNENDDDLFDIKTN
ncbi:MAG: helix-turn-helix domain-containing protein [Syntrophothermus sp.]